MRKKIIVFIIVALILVIGSISFIFFNNRIVSKIYLDINPSVEINLTNNDKVKRIVALNDDAKYIINEDLIGKSLDDTINIITDNVIDKGYIEDGQVVILLYSNGNIQKEKIELKIKNSFGRKEIYADIIVIDKITKEDEEIAKKYNISPAKASYINSILKENENLSIENIVDESVKELNESKNTGNYCDDGYTLEGDWCYKEIERITANTGEVCPRGYLEYDGQCYEEGSIQDGDNYVCREDFKLINNKCVKTQIYEATSKCENGEYDRGYCIEKEYIGDAVEFCRDPGRTLYNHKCLATKPSINGGCLGNDMYYNGKCLNTVNDYYMAEWKCPNGENISNPDGTLQNEDKKCYNETRSIPSSYYCEDDGELNGTSCIKEEIENAQKEQICSNGYTLVNNDKCINYNKTANKENGFVCNNENAKLKDNICVIYEIVESKN